MVRKPVLPELRAATFAAVCLGLAAGAHMMMSQDAIPAWALMVGLVVAYVPARYAAGRGEQGLLGIVGLMGGLQVALHLLFTFAQHAAGTTSGAGSMPGMAMAPGMQMPAGMPMSGTAATAAANPAQHLHMGSGMLLGHAVAALICAWWLWQGEAAVHAVIRSVSFRLRGVWVIVVLTIPPADRTLRPVGHMSRPQTLRSQWRRGALVLRGPPLPLALF
jgi:hypothetical protein